MAGALGVAALASSSGAFVAPGVVSSSAPALRGSIATGPSAAGAAEVTALALGSAAMGAAVASSRRVLRKGAVVRLAGATGVTAEEEPFAGGLIGNESAFSGQNFDFDPMGLATRSPQSLPWFREAELKHGRVAMLAWVGLVVPELFRIPGDNFCFSAANVVEAHNLCVGNPPEPFIFPFNDPLGEKYGYFQGPLFLVYLICGGIELLTTYPRISGIVQQPGLTLENAGNYRLGLNFLPTDPEKAKEMRLKELKNGRLAMLAFGGAITQATLSGNGFPWLYASKSQAPSQALRPASMAFAQGGQRSERSHVARKAEGGYKMSAAVPFLPASPTLKGFAGEEDGFDPMGFSLAIDIRWLREAELKHGRVCMLATAGWIATDLGMRVPGDAFNVSTIEAHNASVKFGGMSQILLWIGLLEVFGALAMIQMYEKQTDRAAGDFGLRTFYPTDEKGQYDMQLKELRNGRLAMLAFSGIITVAVLTGEPWPFVPYKMSAISRSREGATGSTFCGARASCATAITARHAEMSKSVPFLKKPANLEGLAGGEAEFDPLGLSEIYDVRWLREAELKHGRVCMLAALGFATQQYVTFPGLTPTPDANQAPTVAGGGLAALIFVAGFIESASYGGKITILDMFDGEGANREPGDLNFGKAFLPKGKAEESDLREKELANGRLAMLAIGGMINHNIVVKGPLFPLVPDGWTGYELASSWDLKGTTSLIAQYTSS